MHIVYVSNEFPPQFGGGIGTYVAAMSRVLASRGHRVTVISVTDRRYPVREVDSGVTLIRLPLAITSGPEPMATLRGWQSRSEAVGEILSKLVAAEPVDIIEFPDYRGEGTAYLSMTERGRRPVCVVRLHTPLSVLNRFNPAAETYPVLTAFEDQGILSADHVVSPSRALERELRQHLPSLPEVDLSPHPVAELFLQAGEREAEECETVLYVGRLEQRKGVETLIRAAPALLEACPQAKLRLVGGDLQVGPRIPSMREHLERLLPPNCRSRVEFAGVMPQSDLLEQYRTARFCVFPSHFENFPNTCLEAMAMGRPVVGTSRSGMAEMVADGENGRIVCAEDPEHLAEAMIELFQADPDERREMGRRARQRLIDAYAPERIAEQAERLYDSYVDAPADVVQVPIQRDGVVRHPAVAVVIPCFNHGQYLRESIASVKAQSWPRVECIVVDDGSTDADTIRVVDSLRGGDVRVMRQANQGLSAARNAGIRLSEAPFFVCLDADDRIEPDFISHLMQPHLEDATLGYVYSQVQFFGVADGVWECLVYDPHRLLVENLSVATAVVRRAAFDLVGGYQTDMTHGFEDWDFWLALLAVGYHGHLVKEPLFWYRKHPKGISMLERTQRHRSEMVHRMIEHHRSLFTSMLELSMTSKDAMFFRAHMEASCLRQRLGSVSGSTSSPAQDPLFQSLEAQARIDYITNAGSWRRIQDLKRSRVYQRWARWRYGPDWDKSEYSDPRERLAAIQRSRAYRLIRMMKNVPGYRWYARRKYGPDFVDRW